MKEKKSSTRGKKVAPSEARQFDKRDYRRALGQFATGVTIVTAHTKKGRPIGLTVNSFTSVSLDPPLVLWSLSRQATDFAELHAAGRFAVNVLSAGQHHLSRQFSTTLADKFVDVEYEKAPDGSPLLKGATAHFICRVAARFDGGDHVIVLGEVEDYRWNEGEPLVFHSGGYHVTTRHPDLPD
jgi:flavin reductase (DIM6/NTAB) family NADH-FMN oxidoreductase RutF